MLDVFALQLPLSVCIVWCFLVILKRNKTYSDRLLVVLLALMAAYYICDTSHLVAAPDYRRLVVLDIVAQFASLAVFPLGCIYIRSLFDDTSRGWAAYLLLLPALLLAVYTIVVTSLIGIGNCSSLIRMYDQGLMPNHLGILENSYLVLTHRAYNLAILVSFSISMVYISYRLFLGKFKFGHISDFLRGNKFSFISNIICIFFIILCILMSLRFILGINWFSNNTVWTSILSFFTAVVLFLTGYLAAIPTLPGGYLNMDRILHPFDAMKHTRQEYLAGLDSGPVAGKQVSGYDKLMDSFQELMVKKQGFLDPAMTIDEISRQLNTNRTYVSKLVNIYQGMPFRDYLNKLRIDYSKQLMLDEPDAVIDYISAKSGFQSATQFIRKFRETEGVTPSVWRSSQKKR